MSQRLWGRGYEFDVICIEKAIWKYVVWQVIGVDDKLYRTYIGALGDMTYGLSRLGQVSTDVNLKGSPAEETFNPVYYNGEDAVSSEFSQMETMIDRIKGFI